MSEVVVGLDVHLKNTPVAINGYVNGFNLDIASFVLTAGIIGANVPPKFYPNSGWGVVNVTNGGTYSGTLGFQFTYDLEGAFGVHLFTAGT
jgi:hypothetical protein